MKKILFILSNLCIGGAEKQTVALANGLAKKGFEVVIVSLGNGDQLANEVCDSIQVVFLNKRSFVDFVLLQCLKKEIKSVKPDFLIMVNLYTMLYVYFATRSLRKRPILILTHHTTILKGFKEKLKNIVNRRIMNEMDKVVFVCRNQMEYWVSKYSIKEEISTVIHNGIDLNKFSNESSEDNLKKELNIGPDEIVIGINACLRPEKKHEDLIKAGAELIRQEYKIKILLIGDGVQRPYLERIISEKKLEEQVIITGYISEVAPYLSILDIAVLPSVAVETFSMAILECMAMGKSIIMTDIGGASELIIEGENGYLCPPNNVSELVDSIKKIIDTNSFKSFGEVSYNRVKTLFTEEIMINKYEELLTNI